jgi:hypothetical protein
VRTPFAGYGRSPSQLRSDDLLAATVVAACERLGVPLERVEDITTGCVNTSNEGIMGDIGHRGALAAGCCRLGAGGHRQSPLRLISERRHQHRPRHPRGESRATELGRHVGAGR